MMPAPHINDVLESFDNIADIFDDEFENAITRRLRQLIYETIGSLVPPGAGILDINCGTGIDAIALAQRGYRICGIDLAPRMVERARSKILNADIPAKFWVSSFEHIEAAAGAPFDLVLSNFGGLNCVEHLDKVAGQAASLIKPGGYFVGVVMSRLCLWETVAGLSKLDFGAAFRRLRRNVPATGFRGKTFSVHYHPPRGLGNAFSPWFEVRDVQGLNILSPPPHAARLAERHPTICSVLCRMENAIAGVPFARSIGDHYLITLRRRA